ncbi:MAG TPA: LysR family transcriptional regulator [Candidatus Aquabacterium excrementipullorum]|nr:LysR family transcriptional regulator [Candidatus Aquabacterium excrementipullorum]
MDRLQSMRIFSAVAEARSFAGAARELRLSAPAVTRAVAALEQHLGARLLHRSTRLVRLTEVGERYLVDCRRLLSELDEAEALAGGAHVAPQGHLTVTAPVLFGRMHIAPLLLGFLQAHPQLTARAFFADRLVNLLDEGMDVAVRIAHLADSSLTAVRVGEVRRVIVASPDYLASHGEPLHPDDLPAHEAVGSSIVEGPSPRWSLVQDPVKSPGKPQQGAQPRIRLSVNGGEVGIMAARAGQGLARALSYQVADDVAAGRLRVVLAPFEPPPIPVQLVYPEGRMAAAKVRAFVDFAVAGLRAHPALNPPAPIPHVPQA